MAKIVHFKSKKQKAEEWLKDIFAAHADKIKSAVVLINTGEDVVTCYLNADVIEKLNLKQHLEFDILDCFMSQNINRYIEYIE